jgi:hypothetical protein
MCVAVGSESAGRAVNRSNTLIEEWNGERWKAMSSPNMAGMPNNDLDSVSCANRTWCVAVGNAAAIGGTGNNVPLAEFWDGSHWSLQDAPDPGSATDNILVSVDCPAVGTCIAVGTANIGGGVTAGQTLTEELQSGSWSIMSSPNPSGGAALNMVTCTSVTACIAVGALAGQASFTGPPYVLAWNGSVWNVEPSAAVSNGGELNGVACLSSSACEAVGADGAFTAPLAEGYRSDSAASSSTPLLTVPSTATSTTQSSGTSVGSQLGSLNLQQYCEDVGAGTSEMSKPQIGPGDATNNWTCTGTQSTINMDAACQDTYSDTSAIAKASDPNDAYSWLCFSG